MLVNKRMKSPVITVPYDMPVVDALNLLKHEHIRRAPVIKDGKLVGIVSEKDLLYASPSPATSLSVWEINYLVSKIKVSEVMNKEVFTVSEDTPIEEAARIMADNKVGGLPVMRGDQIVGIITETDLFKIFLELMGARETGIRATVLIKNQPGQLALITQAVASKKGDFVAFGQFTGVDQTNKTVTFKVTGIPLEDLRNIIEPLVVKLVDIREVKV
ncbi:MAG: CBS domain-containing protein [Anaerolineaceae bacterium]